MPANTDPIYSRKGALGSSAPSSGNTLGKNLYRTSTYDGTNTTTDAVIFTADATNGSYVQRLRFKAGNGANATAAVARVWINNGSTQSTAANNFFYDEISLPTTTTSTTAATASIDLQMNFALPAGYKIIVGVSSSADLAGGWVVTAIAGDY